MWSPRIRCGSVWMTKIWLDQKYVGPSRSWTWWISWDSSAKRVKSLRTNPKWILYPKWTPWWSCYSWRSFYGHNLLNLLSLLFVVIWKKMADKVELESCMIMQMSQMYRSRMSYKGITNQVKGWAINANSSPRWVGMITYRLEGSLCLTAVTKECTNFAPCTIGPVTTNKVCVIIWLTIELLLWLFLNQFILSVTMPWTYKHWLTFDVSYWQPRI